MTARSILLQAIIGASLLAASVPAIAAPSQADLSIADRPGTPSSMSIRVFNESPLVGGSAYGVTVTVQPIVGIVTGLFAPSNCIAGSNGSFVCNLNRVDGHNAKFLNFGLTLAPNACRIFRNGQIKVATASVTSKTFDTYTGNNMTNVYIRTSCN